MDRSQEYHDPDYPEVSVAVKEEAPKLSEEDKVEKIKTILCREFSNELEIRENEVMLIEQRMSTSRQLLQRLRYVLVSNYFQEQKLQLSGSQIEDDVAAQHEPRVRAEVSTVLREGQRRLHPSVRKLLGKKTADLAEIFKIRAPRNKSRKDYQAMVQSRNYTIPADATKSLRPEKKQEDEEEPSTSGAIPKKVPRQIDPRGGRVLTLEEATRNKMKHRYRLIIGNTSKYAPPASRLDRSTHKWLLYVRGPPLRPDPAPVLTHVVATLHHSYAPHHIVHVYKPPFHITRRGWGEFPARVELHFPLPEVNRPVAVEHTIKLDRNYTGLQTLGSETVIEVWLYSTPEMLEFEYIDPDTLSPPDSETQPQHNHIDERHIPDKMEVEPVTEVKEEVFDHTDSWMEFFSKDTTELDVDEMIIKPVKKEPIEEKTDVESELDAEIDKEDEVEVKTEYNEVVNDIPDVQPVAKRIMKYIDSTTGKIYYLEMDRTLDLSKVQEIVINNTNVKISPIKSNGLKTFRKKKGVSLLKPEVQNQLKNENCKIEKPQVNNFTHIENDHCYLGYNWFNTENLTIEETNSDCVNNSFKVKKEKSHFDTVCSVISKFACVKMCVNYLLKNIPIITDRARDPDYVSNFPFVVDSGDRYWRLDFAKRRNIEWSRAKLINKIVTDHYRNSDPVWRTKQILIYARLHGYHPVRQEIAQKLPETDEWSSWNDLENSRRLESNIKEIYPNASDINSLTIFNSDQYQNSLSESLELTDTDEEVDIVSGNIKTKVKTEVLPDTETSLTVLPTESEEDRLRFMFIEKKCGDIGIYLRNEDVGNGYSYSAVHAVLLSATRSLAEELVRGALGAAPGAALGAALGAARPRAAWPGWSRNSSVQASDVFAACRSGRLTILSAAARGARDTHKGDAL